MTHPKREWFYRLFALALVVRVVEDQFNGRWAIQSGELFPWRHMPMVPLLPAPELLVEWTGLIIAAVGLAFGWRRRACATLASLLIALSLTQMFQNQKLLLFSIALALAIGGDAENEDTRWYLKWQLVVVYGFTVAHKFIDGFADGAVLQNLAQTLLAEPLAFAPRTWVLQALTNQDVARVASLATLAVEITIPFALFRLPRAGFTLVVLFRLGLSLTMPDLAAFGFAMASLAFLFVPSNEAR